MIATSKKAKQKKMIAMSKKMKTKMISMSKKMKKMIATSKNTKNIDSNI